MKTSIYEVEDVQIDRVEWIESNSDRDTAPTLGGVTCVVDVVVSYRHTP